MGWKEMVRRHPMTVFSILTIAFSWTLWGLMIASARAWLPFRFPINWTGSFGPAFGAITTTALAGGRRGVGDLLRPVGAWRFGAWWWLFVTLGSLVPFLAALAAWFMARGGAQGAAGFIENLPLLPFYYPIVLLIGGPLGEEIGWRGFALPTLLRRFSPLAASILLAALWTMWHIPLFWMEGAAQKGSSLLLFAVAVLGFSILFTWVYLGTAGSLLAPLLLHTGINLPAVLGGEGSGGFADEPLFMAIQMGLWFALALGVLALERRVFFRAPATPAPDAGARPRAAA